MPCARWHTIALRQRADLFAQEQARPRPLRSLIKSEPPHKLHALSRIVAAAVRSSAWIFAQLCPSMAPPCQPAPCPKSFSASQAPRLCTCVCQRPDAALPRVCESPLAPPTPLHARRPPPDLGCNQGSSSRRQALRAPPSPAPRRTQSTWGSPRQAALRALPCAELSRRRPRGRRPARRAQAAAAARQAARRCAR